MNPVDDTGDPADLLLPLDQYEQLASIIKMFARGWNLRNVAVRISELHQFVILNSSHAISIDRRRNIARLARDLLSELTGLGGVGTYFRVVLSALAQNAPSKEVPKLGQHSVRDSIRSMAVRLYLEAAAKPGFSLNGPAFRFVEAVRQLVLRDGDAYTNDAVRAEFRNLRRKNKPRNDGPLRSPPKERKRVAD